MTHHVLLDVDTGLDDALAIMFAMRHPDIDVQAITCVSGNTSVENVLGNTLSVLDVLDAPHLPVAAGARCPLIETTRDASWLHGKGGLRDLDLPPSDRVPEPVHAVELIRRTLLAADQPLTIVALAALTNIALFLRMYPELSDRIERIFLMGGSASFGNATPVAEFNIWHDPEAAHIVFSSGVPLTMYGWDVAADIRVTPDHVAKLRTSSSRVSQTAARLLDFEVPDPASGSPLATDVIGDAGTVCALVAPELFVFERWPVHVSLPPGSTRGQTIVDRRRGGGEDSVYNVKADASLVDVARSAHDDSDVLDLFLTALTADA